MDRVTLGQRGKDIARLKRTTQVHVDKYGNHSVAPSTRGLVLERRLGECVVIEVGGVRVVVEVTLTGKTRTKLHFVAPRDVSILRAELVDDTHTTGTPDRSV